MAAQGGAPGVQARKPEVFYVTLEIPAGFLEWTEASGQEMSRLEGHLAPHRVATMPELHQLTKQFSVPQPQVEGDTALGNIRAALPELGVMARATLEPSRLVLSYHRKRCARSKAAATVSTRDFGMELLGF